MEASRRESRRFGSGSALLRVTGPPGRVRTRPAGAAGPVDDSRKTWRWRRQRVAGTSRKAARPTTRSVVPGTRPPRVAEEAARCRARGPGGGIESRRVRARGAESRHDGKSLDRIEESLRPRGAKPDESHGETGRRQESGEQPRARRRHETHEEKRRRDTRCAREQNHARERHGARREREKGRSAGAERRRKGRESKEEAPARKRGRSSGWPASSRAARGRREAHTAHRARPRERVWRPPW